MWEESLVVVVKLHFLFQIPMRWRIAPQVDLRVKVVSLVSNSNRNQSCRSSGGHHFDHMQFCKYQQTRGICNIWKANILMVLFVTLQKSEDTSERIGRCFVNPYFISPTKRLDHKSTLWWLNAGKLSLLIKKKMTKWCTSVLYQTSNWTEKIATQDKAYWANGQSWNP